MRRFRQFPMLGGKRGGIPSGWVEVEYLEGVAGAYINTGVRPGEDATVSFVFMMPSEWASYTSYWDLFGCNNGEANRFCFAKQQAQYAFWRIGDKSNIGLNNISTQYGAKIDEKIVVSNGTYSETSAALSANRTGTYSGTLADKEIFVFKANSPSNYAPTVDGLRFYEVKIWKSGIPALTLVPVRNATTNEGAMCDVLTGDIYRNAGTGAFVAGPDKAAWTNPYVTDGLVAMWDGEWNAGGGVHDAAATVIKDLMGSNDLAISAQGKELVSEDSFSTSIGNNSWDSTKPEEIAALVRSGSFTIEFVGRVSDYGNSQNWFYFDDNTRVYSMDNHAIYWVRFGASLTNFSGYSPPIDGSAFHIAFRIGGESNSAFVNGEKVCAISKSSGAIPDSFSVLKSAYGFWCKTFRISTALTDAQIAANYAIDKERFGLA